MIEQQTNPVDEFAQFSKRYEELLNDSVRITGETGEYFAAYKATFAAARVAFKPDCKILDYGCGIGLLSGQLKRHFAGARVDGYDVSEMSMAQVDPALRAQGIFASRITSLDRDYDLVVAANVLHHIEAKGRQETVSTMASLLGPGGKLAIFEHNPANPLTRRAVDRCPFDENAILLPPRETMSYVARGGLSPIQLDYIVFFPRVLKWLRPLESRLGWCPLGAQYAVVACNAVTSPLDRLARNLAAPESALERQERT